MNKANPLNAYRETKIKTASQGKLIVMLYDEAIRQLSIASEALQKGKQNFDQANNAILKAQDIVTELIVSLDFERGGEIARGLFSLYSFFNQQLVQANLKKDVNSIYIIKDLLVELRAAWASIENLSSGAKPVAGVNIAGFHDPVCLLRVQPGFLKLFRTGKQVWQTFEAYSLIAEDISSSNEQLLHIHTRSKALVSEIDSYWKVMEGVLSDFNIADKTLKRAEVSEPWQLKLPGFCCSQKAVKGISFKA